MAALLTGELAYRWSKYEAIGFQSFNESNTCKSFLSEGLEELWLKVTWETGPYHVPFANTYWTHHVNRADIKLLNPAMATHLTLRIIELDADYCGNHKDLLWWYIPTLDKNELAGELKRKELVAGLPTLRFAFMLQGLERFYSAIPKNQRTECDIQLLLAMPAIVTDQPATTGICHFTRLPREVRNMVYIELWNQRPRFRIKYEDIYLLLGFDISSDCFSRVEDKGLPI